MARPRIPRRIRFDPESIYFKPAGVPMRNLEEIVLTFEEAEAIKLKDFVDLEQRESAKKMLVSQPTFYRTLVVARKKIADAIVNGKAIRIKKQ